MPVQALRVFGKSVQRSTTGAQLIPSSILKDSVTNSGVTYTKQYDGSYRRTGTATDLIGNVWIAGGYFESVQHPNYKVILTLPEGTYTAIDCIMFAVVNETPKGYSGTFTLEESQDFCGIRNINFESGVTYNDIVYLMLSKGKTALPFEPYTGSKPSPSIGHPQEIENAGGDEEIELQIFGSNLLNITDAESGMMRVSNLGGEILVETLKESVGIYTSLYYTFTLEPGTYTLKADSFSDYYFTQKGARVQLNTVKEDIYLVAIGEDTTHATFTLKEKEEIKIFIYNGYKEAGKSYKIKGLRINVDKEQPFEPYKHKSITFPTPNGLPGIPVTTGGNYTDQSGQQWVCDSIEYCGGQAEYVQRVAMEIPNINSSTNVVETSDNPGRYIVSGILKNKYKRANVACIVTHGVFMEWANNPNKLSVDAFAVTIDSLYVKPFKATTAEGVKAKLIELVSSENPLKVIAQLETPIRTPLTQNQLNAIKQLHTFRPTTIITNNAGVDMQVEYVANAKAYIDSKFDALNKTILDTIGGK